MSPSSYLKGVIPLKAWSGKKLNVEHFKKIGNITFIHMPKKILSKLDNKTTQGSSWATKGSHTKQRF